MNKPLPPPDYVALFIDGEFFVHGHHENLTQRVTMETDEDGFVTYDVTLHDEKGIVASAAREVYPKRAYSMLLLKGFGAPNQRCKWTAFDKQGKATLIYVDTLPETSAVTVRHYVYEDRYANVNFPIVCYTATYPEDAEPSVVGKRIMITDISSASYGFDIT